MEGVVRAVIASTHPTELKTALFKQLSTAVPALADAEADGLWNASLEWALG